MHHPTISFYRVQNYSHFDIPRPPIRPRQRDALFDRHAGLITIFRHHLHEASDHCDALDISARRAPIIKISCAA